MKGSIMAAKLTFADFIHLHKDFKDVFSLDSDIEKESLWKDRFIFTTDFDRLVDTIAPLLSRDEGGRKAILLTGKYGVGKSHATGVLSHLLWDELDSIKDDILERARNHKLETGATLQMFREEGRYFPVLLTGRESNGVSDALSFEYSLQIGLERALKKYGYYEKIAERTEFEKHALWVKELVGDPERATLRQTFEEALRKSRDFPTLKDLIDALEDRDATALTTINDLFRSLHLANPWHSNTKTYYDSVLDGLKKVDPSIKGIIIYWDEFTTVFYTAGQNHDEKLISLIQVWAEYATSGIVLFLVSHITPEALRGRYPTLNDPLALVSDRFTEANVKMEQLTTFHLIAESLQVKERKEFDSFLKDLGFGDEQFQETIGLCNRLMTDACLKDELQLRKTIPLHIYSTYVAAKIADLLGSAERSIFQLLHDSRDETFPYGSRIGFQRFLATNPIDNDMTWYSIDRVFDYFYTDLADNDRELKGDINIQRTLNAFRRDYPIARQIGDDAVRVFKAIVLMEMMYAKTGDTHLLPTKQNLVDAFSQTEIGDLPALLTEMVNKPVLAPPYEDKKQGVIIYKTRYTGGDPGQIEKHRKDLLQTHTFEKLLETYQDDIIAQVQLSAHNVPRLANHIPIFVVGEDGLKQRKKRLLELDAAKEIGLVVAVPKDHQQLERMKKSIREEFAEKTKWTLFLLNEGDHRHTYDAWIEALANERSAQDRHDGEAIQESHRQLEGVHDRFIQDLNLFELSFRHHHFTQANNQSKNIARCIEDIYPKGFDFANYTEFWKPPKKYTYQIFLQYGQPNGRQVLKGDKNYIVQRMLDLLSTGENDPLVDDTLRLRKAEFVKSAGLALIAEDIGKYVRNNSGKYLSLRVLIDTLGLEKPPYGLRAWHEAIVIAYALAPFYAEGRLEVQISNGSPKKDAVLITDAIGKVIKNPGDTQYIRYGSADENRLAKQLKEVFGLETETKTLVDALFQVRNLFNTTYKLPLWVLEYGLSNIERIKLAPFLAALSELIESSPGQSEFDSDEIRALLEHFKEAERVFQKSIWQRLFTPEAFLNGFTQFVQHRYQQLLSAFPSSDALLARVREEVTEDVWLWKDNRVSDVLAKIVIGLISPSQVEEVVASIDRSGNVVLVWDPPGAESGLPNHYKIFRGESSGVPVLHGRTAGIETRYVDSKIQTGITYSYTVRAWNQSGTSDPSEAVSIRILPPPPQIALTVTPGDGQFALSWDSPDPAYEIQSFAILRGTSVQDLKEIETVADDKTTFYDLDVEPGTRYYYGIRAINADGQAGQLFRSGQVALPRKEPPSISKNFKAERMGNGLRLTWSPPDSGRESVAEYQIVRQDESGLSKDLANLGPDRNSYQDDTVEPGKKYSYQLSAANEYGKGHAASVPPLNTLMALPAPVLSAFENDGEVHLQWDPLGPEYGITKIHVLRSEGNSSPHLLKKIDPAADGMIDQNAKPGRLYKYSLVYWNEQGDQRESDEPVVISPSLKGYTGDIGAWQEETSLLAASDPKLFLTALGQALEMVIESIPDKENSPLARIRAALTEMFDE